MIIREQGHVRILEGFVLRLWLGEKPAMSMVNLNSLVEAKRLVDKYSSIIEILEKADIADFIFIRDSRKEKV